MIFLKEEKRAYGTRARESPGTSVSVGISGTGVAEATRRYVHGGRVRHATDRDPGSTDRRHAKRADAGAVGVFRPGGRRHRAAARRRHRELYGGVAAARPRRARRAGRHEVL